MRWPFARPYRDPIEVKLQQIEHANERAVRTDHRVAFMLVLVAAAASVVGLAGDALNALLTNHADGKTAVDLVIAFAIVVGVNRALLAAARAIRRGKSRRQPDADLIWHVRILIGMALVEAISFTYMQCLFEHPTWSLADAPKIALIVLRALCVPIAMVYLEMQQVWPIDPQDIGLLVEQVSGIGVLRDVAVTANDRAVPLAPKIQMYHAAADLTATQSQKLAGMQRAAEAYAAYRAPVQIVDASGQPLASPAPHPKTTAPKAPPALPPRERRDRIVAMLRDGEPVSVRTLTKRFGVAHGTAQADLAAARERVDATRQPPHPVRALHPVETIAQ